MNDGIDWLLLIYSVWSFRTLASVNLFTRGRWVLNYNDSNLQKGISFTRISYENCNFTWAFVIFRDCIGDINEITMFSRGTGPFIFYYLPNANVLTIVYIVHRITRKKHEYRRQTQTSVAIMLSLKWYSVPGISSTVRVLHSLIP